MYYNRILRVWVLNLGDYFLLSALIGSLINLYLKNYLSEKEAMKRLKNSIINKSKLISNGNRPILNSKETKMKKIFKVALDTHGGQFENTQADHEFSNEVFKLAQEIKRFVERLASFLKERELKGVARIFFKNGRLLLELILSKCRIDITYSLLTEGNCNNSEYRWYRRFYSFLVFSRCNFSCSAPINFKFINKKYYATDFKSERVFEVQKAG